MTEFVRSSARAADALRPVRITRGYTVHAEGSVLIEFGGSILLQAGVTAIGGVLLLALAKLFSWYKSGGRARAPSGGE